MKNYDLVAGVTAKNPKLFETQINKVFSSLHIEIAEHVLAQFLRHLKELEFLDALETHSIAIEIEIGPVNTMQFLSESKVWYQFRLETHNVFAEYRIQQNVAHFNAITLRDNIKRLIQNDESTNSQITFGATGIKEFYDQIGTLSPALDSIKLNAMKLKLFNNLLEQSMIETIDTTCTPEKFVVMGNYIKISDFIDIQCNAISIKVMAVFKTFVDADLSAQGKTLHIISPAWEVIGERKFNLNGVNGAEFDSAAPNGEEGWPDKAGTPGNAGQPGRTGGPGSNFFGVGDTFISDDNLKLNANGGNGGTGQNGGKGSS